jgi:hypothetical protein
MTSLSTLGGWRGMTRQPFSHVRRTEMAVRSRCRPRASSPCPKSATQALRGSPEPSEARRNLGVEHIRGSRAGAPPGRSELTGFVRVPRGCLFSRAGRV